MLSKQEGRIWKKTDEVQMSPSLESTELLALQIADWGWVMLWFWPDLKKAVKHNEDIIRNKNERSIWKDYCTENPIVIKGY